MTELITTWQRFAEITIKTNDLDPMYEVIYKLNKTKSRKWMGVFLMTFLLYYDAGQAIREADFHCSDLDLARPYWEEQLFRAQDPKFRKRGTERRHMRGENERKALEKLASFGLEPWELLMDMCSGMESYSQLYRRMSTVFSGTQFGPYFIWKLYDIFNVCLDMPISMSREEAFKYMPDEPKKVLYELLLRMDSESGWFVLKTINDYVSQFDHPVLPGRKCSYAETETILCMIKGFFLTKTHVIGDDILEKNLQLAGYPEIQALLPGEPQEVYQRGELQL